MLGSTGNPTCNVTRDVTRDMTRDMRGNMTRVMRRSITGNMTGDMTRNVTRNVTDTERRVLSRLSNVGSATVEISSVRRLWASYRDAIVRRKQTAAAVGALSSRVATAGVWMNLHATPSPPTPPSSSTPPLTRRSPYRPNGDNPGKAPERLKERTHSGGEFGETITESNQEMSCRAIYNVAKHYCANCNIHGMRYMAEAGRHWVERIFWLACCIMSWWASIYLILQSWNDFTGESAISFNIRTDHVEWNTQFPSVIFCETRNTRGFRKAFDVWANEHFKAEFPDFIKKKIHWELHYFDGQASALPSLCLKKPCPSNNITDFAMTLRYTCDELLVKCYWNGMAFPCCDYFHSLPTELGECFAINNVHTKGKRMNMASNITTGPGNLTVYLGSPAKTYVLPPQDVPEVGLVIPNYVDAKILEMSVVVREIQNDESVRSASLAQRQCRFPDENVLKLYDKYTFNGCIVECRHNAYLKLCNCSSPHMPRIKPEEVCNLEGILCILSRENGKGWRRLRPAWVNSSELYCNCPLNCETMDIKTIVDGTKKYRPSGTQSGGTEVVLIQLAHERLERLVVRTLLDLVVNVGGTLGLLMGASLLSVVEVFHFFGLPLCRALVARFCGDCGCREPPRPPPRAPSAIPQAALPLRRVRAVLKAPRALTGRDPEPPAKALTLPGVMDMPLQMKMAASSKPQNFESYMRR